MLFRNMLFTLAVLLSTSAWAADVNNDNHEVVVKNAWTTETVPGQTKVALRMDVTCTSSYGKLVEVDSPLAASGGIERLRPLHGRLAVQTLTSVHLRHGRAMSFSERTISLVLKGLKQPLKVGDTVPVTLTIYTAGKKVQVDVPVEVRAAELSYKAYENVEMQKQHQ
ncbi:MAG TPA: copper chaperone PCu(A)C [Gallionellaceae bacterium]|nr:copper chaperone PCu(A)C [Gallionellaceae bacterium]